MPCHDISDMHSEVLQHIFPEAEPTQAVDSMNEGGGWWRSATIPSNMAIYGNGLTWCLCFGMFRRSQGHFRYLQIVSKCSFHLFRLHQKHTLTCDSVAIPWPMALQVEPSGESQGGPGLGRKDPVSSVEVATRIIDRWAEEQTTSRFPDPIADVDGVWWCLGMLWCINIISSSIIIIIITYNYIRLSTVYMIIYYDILKILASFGIKANNVSTSTAWEPFTCRSMWM